MKQHCLCLLSDPDTRINPSLLTHPDSDTTVWRTRASAFSRPPQNLAGVAPFPSLTQVLEEHGINHLILLGVATSGIVLSTVLDAWDQDFKITVLGDGCFDPDPEVHRVLVGKVFAQKVEIRTVREFCEGVKGDA